MSGARAVRVFFEPRIAAHPPELYRFDGFDDGIDAGAVGSEAALRRYREDGFLMVRGLLPLDELLPPAAIRDQAENTVGPSYESYLADGHLWAMAIDAACQVSSYRADLLDDQPPRTWDEIGRAHV